MNKKDLTSLIEELLEETLEEAKKKKAKKKKSSGKKDACYHKVKSRYKVWPSAYASGALVRCRKVGAKNWGKSTNEGKESEPDVDYELVHSSIEEFFKDNKNFDIVSSSVIGSSALSDEEKINHDLQKYGRARSDEERDIDILVRVRGLSSDEIDSWHFSEESNILDSDFGYDVQLELDEETLEEKKRKLTKKPSSETNLGDWFKRKGAKGSSGGWVDCNAPDGKGGYKTCGRKKGEKRSKYPACRPTPSACKSKGKGKKWGKKASKRKNESMNNLQKLIESEVLSLLNEAKDRDIESIIKASNQSEHQAFFDPSGNVKPEAEQDYKKTFNDLKSKLQNVPTGYIPWIVKTAKGDPEPLPEIITSLKSYIENKSKFGGKKLSALTPGDIRLALEDSNEPADSSNKESNTTVPAGNDQIYNSTNWIGVYPKTKEGSIKACKKLSSGVQWCTAATQSKNYFNEYTGQYNIHLYYFYKKGGKSRSNPNDAIAIGWVKEGDSPEIIYGSNATVNAANRDLKEKDLKEIFGEEEWEKIQSAMLQDLGREERKETAFNKIISNLTPGSLNAQLEAIDDPEEKIETLLNLLKNEAFVQNKETTNFAILKLVELSGFDENLNLSGTKITTLPDNLEVGGDLNLYGSKITTLPDKLTVGGSLNLSYTNITTLPDGLKVGGNLHLYKSEIETLPDNLEVGGNLHLFGTKITTLPDGLKVRGDLNLSYTDITTLPHDLEVDGEIFGPDGKKMEKSAKGIKESMKNLQQLIESEILSILNETDGEESKKVKMNSLTFLQLTRMEPGKDANPEELEPLKGLGLDNLSWLNPGNLSKTYNPAKDRDPMFLEFKKEGGRYKVVDHEGRHRNLGNILNILASGKKAEDAEIKVELKGDIPPSGTEVLAQQTGKGVQISYEELKEVESNATESFSLDKELDELDKKERNLNDIFTELRRIGADNVKSLNFTGGWDAMVEKFNEKYRIKLQGEEGEGYELAKQGEGFISLILKNSNEANRKVSPLYKASEDIDDDEAMRASMSWEHEPYMAQIVDNSGSPDIPETQDNIQEQILKETIKLFEATNISEGMQYHLDNKIPITETVYRPLSESFMRLMKEARTLYSLGLYEGLSEGEREILESDLGEVDVYEGVEVPLDLPMLEEEELDEAKYKGKEVSLGKPTKGDVKKYKVYVRNKNGKVIKVNYGSKDMKGNWNDPKARKSFAARHKCAEKKDKTKPGWWACRAHKHFGKNVSGAYW